MSLQEILVLLGCYLLGALPFSVWIGKAFFKTDVRQHGSGNPGATNMLRTLGAGPAIVVLLLDIGKGVAAVLLAAQYDHLGTNPPIERDLGGFLAVLGHMYSPFLGFKGGKGVATTVGVMCTANPILGFTVVFLFTIVVAATSYVSLASILMVIAYAVNVAVFSYTDTAGPAVHIKVLLAVVMAGLVVYKHRSNMQRLLAGTENKLKLKKTPAENK
jgi:glycerol-3-phosphate acyltransferase PlsY